jgi:hypothetical protein
MECRAAVSPRGTRQSCSSRHCKEHSKRTCPSPALHTAIHTAKKAIDGSRRESHWRVDREHLAATACGITSSDQGTRITLLITVDPTAHTAGRMKIKRVPGVVTIRVSGLTTGITRSPLEELFPHDIEYWIEEDANGSPVMT